MAIREKIIDFWDSKLFDGVNRRALKQYMNASKRYQRGGRINRAIALLLNQRYSKKYGCNIYPSAKLGEGLYIPHFVGIVVGSTTEIGENCVVFPGVVFGAAYSPARPNPKGRRHPKCGNNCIFGANSTLIGNISIGSDVTIGAGAVVTKDIPDNAIVIGANQIIGYRDGTKKEQL